MLEILAICGRQQIFTAKVMKKRKNLLKIQGIANIFISKNQNTQSAYNYFQY